jgi:hypothetical protein
MLFHSMNCYITDCFNNSAAPAALVRNLLNDNKENIFSSGPDSDVGSVDDLPIDDDDGGSNDAKNATSDVTAKVTAGASYIGSFFTSAWSKTAKTANEATHGGSAFFSSALQKVGGKLNYESDLHCLSVCVSLSVCLSVCVCLSVSLYVCQSVCLSVCMSCQSVCLSVCMSVCLCLSVCLYVR